MAMLYIDLTGTPKVKGFLTTYAETQRLALLTELRDCGLLEEKEYTQFISNEHITNEEVDGHNTLAHNIKAHLDELIKSNSTYDTHLRAKSSKNN
jgi:hypothetical protein